MDTNNKVIAIALAGMLVSSSALAGQDVVPPEGTVFCGDQEHLHEFLLAAVQNDAASFKQLQLRDCRVLLGGTSIRIIEELPNASPLGHVSKVRVILKTGTSVVGYIMVFEK
jgi:hypothetical protein